MMQTLPSAKRKRTPAGGYTEVDTVKEPLLYSAGNADLGNSRPEDPFGGSDEALDTKVSKSVMVEDFEVLSSPDIENEDDGEFHSGRAYTTIRSILIPQVLYPILNYAFLAFVDQSVVVLLPLIYSIPVSSGGLGFQPFTIGTVQGTTGIIGSVVQIFTFPYMHERLGVKMMYIYGIATASRRSCPARAPSLSCTTSRISKEV